MRGFTLFCNYNIIRNLVRNFVIPVVCCKCLANNYWFDGVRRNLRKTLLWLKLSLASQSGAKLKVLLTWPHRNLRWSSGYWLHLWNASKVTWWLLGRRLGYVSCRTLRDFVCLFRPNVWNVVSNLLSFCQLGLLALLRTFLSYRFTFCIVLLIKVLCRRDRCSYESKGALPLFKSKRRHRLSYSFDCGNVLMKDQRLWR